jgi:hypothetical protein
MSLIQTTTDSIKFTSSINETKDLDSLCFNSQNDDNKTDIQVFVEYIERKQKLSGSFGFEMLSFLYNNAVDKLMDKIETLLTYLDTNGRVDFTDTVISFQSNQTPNIVTHNWVITIKGIKQLKYAERLLFVYKNYVKPFMDELNHEIQDPRDTHYRFFYFLRKILIF